SLQGQGIAGKDGEEWRIQIDPPSGLVQGVSPSLGPEITSRPHQPKSAQRQSTQDLYSYCEKGLSARRPAGVFLVFSSRRHDQYHGWVGTLLITSNQLLVTLKPYTPDQERETRYLLQNPSMHRPSSDSARCDGKNSAFGKCSAADDTRRTSRDPDHLLEKTNALNFRPRESQASV